MKEAFEKWMDHFDWENQAEKNAFGAMAWQAIEWYKNNQWVSCKDRLPEKQGDFWVRTPLSFPKNIPFQVAEFYDDNNTFYNEYDHPLEDVTHWMPIPKLDN